MRVLSHNLLLVVGLFALTSNVAWGGPSLYHVTDLGTLGGAQSVPYGINAAGQVVGDADLPDGHRHAFLYSGGTMHDLGTLGGGNSTALAINNVGQIVGQSNINVSTSFQHAFLYSGGTMGDLGSLGTQAADINDSGQIAINNSGVLNKASLFSNGMLTPLGTLGGLNSVAYAMNASGQIVGSSGLQNNPPATPFDFPTHAFLYSNGKMNDLGFLQSGPESVATGINVSGQVVGYSEVAGATTQHAFLYSNGVMQDLGTLGLLFSNADDINASGQVVGAASSGNGIPRAFLYTGGTTYDLTNFLDNASAGWNVNEGRAINDNGLIAAVGQFNGGDFHAILLTPVPEPATAVMAAVGVLPWFLWAMCAGGRGTR